MNSLTKIRKIGMLFLILLLPALIPMYGCGGGGGGGGDSATSTPTPTPTDTKLQWDSGSWNEKNWN